MNAFFGIHYEGLGRLFVISVMKKGGCFYG